MKFHRIHRPVAFAVLAAGLISLTGCGSAFLGDDKKITLSVKGNQWKEIYHGYVTIETVPGDAVVSLQTINEVEAHATVGWDESHKKVGISAHDWATIGTSPIANFKVPVSGKTRTAPQLGASMDCTFRLKRLALKVEKPGYETYHLENVVVSVDPDERKLVIKLVPLGTAKTTPTDDDTFAAEDPSMHDER